MSALPSGYIASSARDMTHYLMAFINGGRYGNSRVFSESLITEAQTSIGNTSYGAGWYSAGYYKWHTGEVANYNAYICTVPSENLGIIVLSNTNDIGVKYLNRKCSSLTRIHNGIRVKLMGGPLPDKILLNAKAMYVLVDITIILLFALAIKLFLWPISTPAAKNKPILWLGLRAAVSLRISSALLYAVPVLIKGSWYALLISVPDLTLSALILAALLITAGIINTVKFIAAMTGRKAAIARPISKDMKNI